MEATTPTSKKRLSINEIAKIYKDKAGNISETCRSIGIDRRTWYDRLALNPRFNEKMKAVDEGLIDWAESQLKMNISQGKETSLIFFLKNMKPEVWKDRHEMDFTGKLMLVDVDK